MIFDIIATKRASTAAPSEQFLLDMDAAAESCAKSGSLKPWWRSAERRQAIDELARVIDLSANARRWLARGDLPPAQMVGALLTAAADQCWPRLKDMGAVWFADLGEFLAARVCRAPGDWLPSADIVGAFRDYQGGRRIPLPGPVELGSAVRLLVHAQFGTRLRNDLRGIAGTVRGFRDLRLLPPTPSSETKSVQSVFYNVTSTDGADGYS